MNILAVSDDPDRPETALLAGLVLRGHAVTVVSRLAPGAGAQLPGATLVQHTIQSRLSYRTIKLLRSLAQPVGAVPGGAVPGGAVPGGAVPGSAVPVDIMPFDIIHCFSARALSNALCALAPLVSNRRNISPKIVAYRGTVGHLSRLDPSSWLSFLNPRVAAISCVSHAVKRYLTAQGVPAAKLFVIYKGHQAAWYTEVAAVDQRAAFGIPAEAPIVTFVGNMRSVKGADLLVDAFSALNHPRAHLLLVGEVRDAAVREAVERSTRAFNIHLLGPRSDAPAIVRASDIFVMPSRDREGLPKAVIEALLLSKPVVLSDAGGMPEMITDRESGLMFAAGNVPALTKRLADLIDDAALRTHLGAAGCARARTQFAVGAMIDKTERMYRAVCDLTGAL